MHALGWIIAADATPMPTPTMTVPAESVTPGPLGFAVMALLVVLVFLLVWDMQRRVRRARYRGEVNEELDREERDRKEHADALAHEQAVEAVESTDADDQPTDAGNDPSFADLVERIDDGQADAPPAGKA